MLLAQLLLGLVMLRKLFLWPKEQINERELENQGQRGRFGKELAKWSGRDEWIVAGCIFFHYVQKKVREE